MPSPKPKRKSGPVLAVGLIVVVGLLALKGPLQRQVMLSVALKQDSVTPELVEEIAGGSADPVAVYEKFWKTRKIPHRLAALRAFNRSQNVPELPETPQWLYNAAIDGDLHVRELALGILSATSDPKLEAIVNAWLLEPDPELKRLAMRQARNSGLTNLAHTVGPLLDHPDIQVQIAAASTLRVWTDQDFNVRMTKLSGRYDEETGTYSGDDENKLQQVQDGLEEWRAWWKANAGEQFKDVKMAAFTGTTETIPAPDFTLHSLDHEDVTLSTLRGKPVLLNFWATWCSACWTEIPDLIELNARMGDRVRIIGISLDGLPDQHELDHGHSHHEGHDHVHGIGHEELNRLVGDFVKQKGMDYQILLDPTGITSELYVGNELPMNVMIDAEGNLYRRFMGTRSLAGFQAMLSEILTE